MKNKGDYKKIAELIKPLGIKEKALIKLSKLQQKNDIKWIEEKSRIDFELGQLKTELYYIQQR